jgi:hypothetical protein
VMAVAVPPIMKTPEALAVWGPRTFGLGLDYRQFDVLPGSKLPRTIT